MDNPSSITASVYQRRHGHTIRPGTGKSAIVPDMTIPPAQQGFAMPPEWEPHAATWTSWPFDDDLWEGFLESARREFAQLVSTIAHFEDVYLNVCDEEAESDARARLAYCEAPLERIHFHRLRLNDIWFRDNGPLFIRNRQGQVALTDWVFNAWGGKYDWELDTQAPAAVAKTLGMKRFVVPYVMEGGALELNGQGVCLTTRSCLLTPTRNPGLGESEIERLLHDYLGVRRVVWLERGLENDHTDGHVDTIVRFADDQTIICAVEDDEDDPNYAAMQRNLEALLALRGPDGKPYRVIELPLPEQELRLNGKRLPLTYANFYIGNGFVLVPLYDDVNDERALDILRPLFPGRRVSGLSARAIITGGGAFHCVTQQQPQGVVKGELCYE
ncbi:MAG: agmatine deiminase family protein [Truepera sp.]|nr:agmatine deiminase family protein [Truepera sp.]